MKRILLILTGISSLAFGQTADMVSLGAGYANESYYSFANGEQENVDNNNWHLAFDLSQYGVAVRLNRKQVWLYDSEEQVGNWATTVDTTGMAAGWLQYINGYDFWDEGALNNAADPGNGYDMGWGDYNTTTHQIIGTRIFVLKFNDGTCRKLLIESLIGGAYTVKHADLDGANEVTVTVTKSDYANRNFVYYNVQTDTLIDREPAADSWDIVFTNYVLELAPGYYSGVTGALHNQNIEVSVSSGVPVATATYSLWEDTISTIGYDWKSFNMSTFEYDIVADLCYFVKEENGNIWKLVFTDFEGSSTGNIYFTKELVESAGIPEYEGASLAVYPNPASDFIKVESAHNITEMKLIDMNGAIVLDQISALQTLSLSAVENGVYLLQVINDKGRLAHKRVVVQH